MEFKGIYPPVITPCLDDGGIDFDGFLTILDHLIASGVDGIIIGGTTGEYYAQTPEERIELIKRGTAHIAGRAQVIIGTGAIRTPECIAYGLAAREAGADAILVNSPPYAVPTQAELAEHALEIDRAVALPIMLYNYPGRTGVMMERAFLEQVSVSANFKAIKESSGDIDRLHMLAMDFPNLTLICGADDQALEFFAWGAEGWVCGGANCLPAEHIALYRACAIDKDFVKGRQIMRALMPFLTILEQGGKFAQSIKHACALNGLPAGPVRTPLRDLDEAQKHEVGEVVRTLKAAISKLDTAA